MQNFIQIINKNTFFLSKTVRFSYNKFCMCTFQQSKRIFAGCCNNINFGGICMILSCQNICKSFGEKVILQDASFHIEDREKAALIGNNGAGKTTLLRIIIHELLCASGSFYLRKHFVAKMHCCRLIIWR